MSLKNKNAGNDEENNLQGYPLYPTDEDVYNQYQEEKDINPDTRVH